MAIQGMTIFSEDVKTSVVYNKPDLETKALLVLAHGSSQGMHSCLLDGVARCLENIGIAVVRFNFFYIEQGKKTPDGLKKLELCYQLVLADIKRRAEGTRIFIGGKSLGARVAVQLAATGYKVSGVVCLGYPFHPPGKPEKLNIETVVRLDVPTLFLQGTRDTFANIKYVRPVLEKVGHFSLVEVSGGDHSFIVKDQLAPQVYDFLSSNIESFIIRHL